FHHVGCRNHGVKVGPVFLLDLLHHLLAAYDIRACAFGLAHLLTAGDHQDLLGLAQPMRQDHRSAHHLVGVLGIHPQAQRHLYGLVELCVLDFLKQRHGFIERIGTFLHRCPRLADVLSGFLSHRFYLISHRSGETPGRSSCDLENYAVTSMPMLRAVPFTLLMAASSEAAFRSGIFCLAISATCFSVTLPTLSLFGVPDPLAMPAARFKSTAAGGVLVMNVNERSV